MKKRISITPEIAKKYISSGFEVVLPKNYGEHLGLSDDDYKNVGVVLNDDEKGIIESADLIVQLGLPSDDKLSLLKEKQILIGVLSPHSNKEKLNELIQKKVDIFFL